MRRALSIALFTASGLLAAPLKEDLPTGAVARLGTPVAKDKAAGGEIHALAFIDDGTLFVGGNSGWTTWDLAKRQPRQERPVGAAVHALARGDKQLFIGAAKKLHCIEQVSAKTEATRSWDSDSETVGVVAIAPGGRRVVFSNGEQKLAVLDTNTGKITGTIELASRPVGATLAANGRLLGVVTTDGSARIYNLSANGEVAQSWGRRVGRSERMAIAFSPDGRVIAMSSAGRVMILDAANGRSMQFLERRFGEGDVRSLAFSLDGRHLAVGRGGPEPLVRVSDVEKGAEKAAFQGHLGDVNAVAFSPDGRTLASAGTDTSVLLWKAPVPGEGPELMTAVDAWDTLDSLDADVAYRSMGHLLAHKGRAIEVIRDGFRGMEDEQKRIRKWIAELDHDNFRIRESARRSLVKCGLRAAGALTDPVRKKLGAEGEQRIKLILEAFEAQGLRAPESGLFGEPLRSLRAVRVLETIGGNAARAVLEEAAKGPADARLTIEAKAALATWVEGR
jgi:WD40 repeat protein